jgi:uncharacterized protein (DUF983 family)
MTSPISLPTALARGFAMRCPNCGRGHLFGRFLKVADHCEVCGEDFTPQRADDFPAYLVIIVVGHIVVPTLLAVEIAYAPPVWLQLLIWLPVTLFSALALLQPTKGRDRRAAMADVYAWLRGIAEAAFKQKLRDFRESVARVLNPARPIGRGT